ncbi:Zinc finger C2H2-type [Trinorchestia longiramus]|nr:Zinc finger C2H2-type [Trinorchestia longiramus]
MKDGELRSNSNAIKPFLTTENMKSRVEFCHLHLDLNLGSSNSENPLEAMAIKSEVSDGELDTILVKEEPIDWNQDPQVNSSKGFSTQSFKKEANKTCTEACAEQAEVEDKLKEGIALGASQGSADSLPSDVSNTSVGVEVEHADGLETQPFLCDLCDFSTVWKASLRRHLNSKHKLGVSFKCDLCDYSCALNISLKQHLASKHRIVIITSSSLTVLAQSASWWIIQWNLTASPLSDTLVHIINAIPLRSPVMAGTASVFTQSLPHVNGIISTVFDTASKIFLFVVMPFRLIISNSCSVQQKLSTPRKKNNSAVSMATVPSLHAME